MPGDSISCPVDGICNKIIVVIGGWICLPSIVGGGLTFAKVVGLNIGIVISKPFKVDLIEVVRLEDRAAHDANTRRRFDNELDVAEHDVPF